MSRIPDTFLEVFMSLLCLFKCCLLVLFSRSAQLYFNVFAFHPGLQVEVRPLQCLEYFRVQRFVKNFDCELILALHKGLGNILEGRHLSVGFHFEVVENANVRAPRLYGTQLLIKQL